MTVLREDPVRRTPQRSFSVRELGRGNLGCLFGLLLVGGLGYLGYKFIPPYVDHFQLKDAMTEIAVYNAVGAGSSRGPTTVQEAVLQKAKELEIPLKKEDIKVRHEGDKIFISVKYVIPVELPGRIYDLKFEFTSHN
jgi:hypothetical protein